MSPAVLSCLLLVSLAPFAPAQAVSVHGEDASTAVTSNDGPAGVIPYVKGFNASLGTTSQHDSSNGWSSLLNPDLAYRFNSHISVDATAPIYDYINVEVAKTTRAVTIYTLATKHFVAGDTVLNGHLQFDPSFLSYELTSSLGLPSGNTTYGLGAGQVTYAFNNRFDKDFSLLAPFVELGIGDSSALDQTRVKKSYVSVGTLAHFQAGTSVDLPRHSTFSASAYEDMPLSAQTLYSTTGKGKKKVTTATSKSLGEDNGFQSSLDIPLTPHVTLSGFYNRSLRAHIDTAGFSFTFLLRATPTEKITR